MKRTKFSRQEERYEAINYYDRNQAQRWGVVKKENEDYITAINAYGETEKVPYEKIIERRFVDKKVFCSFTK